MNEWRTGRSGRPAGNILKRPVDVQLILVSTLASHHRTSHHAESALLSSGVQHRHFVFRIMRFFFFFIFCYHASLIFSVISKGSISSFNFTLNNAYLSLLQFPFSTAFENLEIGFSSSSGPPCLAQKGFSDVKLYPASLHLGATKRFWFQQVSSKASMLLLPV